jgi:hypothetical protein
MTPEQEAQVRAYEEATEAEVTSELDADVAAVLASIVAAWLAYEALAQVGKGSLDAVRAAILRLGTIRPRVAERLRKAAERGAALGWELGRPEWFTAAPAEDPTDEALSEAIRWVDADVSRRLEDTARMADTLPLESRRDVDMAVSRGRSAVTYARARARWATNRAVNAGIAQAARDAGMRIVWVAERNACLHCYAYAGLTVAVGEDFPSGLTYGDRPLPPPPGGLPYPPLHPNCRCSVEATDEEGTDVGLAREAARSVARGFSDYASEPARFRAADRLVLQGATLPGSQLPAALPRSVLDRTRRNLAERRFSQRHRPITGLNA